MPIQIRTHVFRHGDTVLEDVITLQSLIESSASKTGGDHHYFFIGETHNLQADVDRREGLAHRIAALKNVTRVIERGLPLDPGPGGVAEADLTSGPFKPARNVGLAKQTIEANAKSGNRVTVFFCGSDHDHRVKAEIELAYKSDPALRAAVWISVGPTPLIPPSAVLRMLLIAEQIKGQDPIGYICAISPNDEYKCLQMSQGKEHDVYTLRIFAPWCVKDCVTRSNKIYAVYVNESGRRAQILSAMNSKGGDAPVQFSSSSGKSDYLLKEVTYASLPEPNYD